MLDRGEIPFFIRLTTKRINVVPRNRFSELAAVMELQPSHVYCVLCGTSLLGKNHFPINLSEDPGKTDSILHFCSMCFLENDLLMNSGESRIDYISRVINCLTQARNSKPGPPPQ